MGTSVDVNNVYTTLLNFAWQQSKMNTADIPPVLEVETPQAAAAA
jgi:hypothetical protein